MKNIKNEKKFIMRLGFIAGRILQVVKKYKTK